MSRLPPILLLLCFATGVAADDYGERKARAVNECEKIPASESQSGLLFNPDGFRSYYVRSQCLQRVAVEFRDEALCSQVRRRYSLFSSSWGISTSNCRALVAKELNSDRAELEALKQQYAANPLRFESFRVVRNGNGRDFDFLPQFSNGMAHGYHLTFEVLREGGTPVVVHSDGYYIDPNSSLRIFVRQSDIRQRFAEFQAGRNYRVRATLTLSVAAGNDGFIESVFPASARSQTLTREVEF